jgi:ApeA-like protein
MNGELLRAPCDGSARTMKSFRIRGLWFLPGNEANPVSGVLTYRPTSGLRLSLMGALAGFSFPGEDHEVVSGVCEQSHTGGHTGGRYVRLESAQRAGTRMTFPGFTTEVYRPSRAYFSSEPLETTRFQRARIRFDYLDEWALVGWHGPSDDFLSSNFHSPPPLSARLDSGLSLTLHYDVETKRSARTFRSSQHATFELAAQQPLEGGEMLQMGMRPLIDLLAVATDRPITVSDVIFSIDDRKNASYVFNPLSAPSGRPLRRTELLFTVAHVRDEFDEFYRSWTALRNRKSAFFGAFVGLILAPPAFVEMRFVWLLHSVSLLARSSSEIRNVNAPEREELDSVKWLVGEILPSQLLDGIADVFLQKVSAAHHRIAQGHPIEPAEVVWTTELLKWAVKSYVLLQLPPLQAQVAALLKPMARLDFARRKMVGE